MSETLQPLEKTLRKKLEIAVKKAREIAESAAGASLEQLEVGAGETKSLEAESDKELRRRLRVHGRQLGDKRNELTKIQETGRLREEVAYQHWHRMLFARFLAENRLLMYPDPSGPVPVTLSDCEDLAADEGAKNGWDLAARYAARMLPQIFRVDSPVFSLMLPTEKQHQLEKLLGELPSAVFLASDSLGWVYQFWQAEAKKRINESEVKIGARELPAVTQLFTEPYMVNFLLDNSLGAWWAKRRLNEEDFCKAKSEQELREKASLPGVSLKYLRFVQIGTQGIANASDLQATCSDQRWIPAAGTFDAWPISLSKLKALDPCCGSGHFLVASLLMLAPMRMELEGLSAREAVDRVLSENLHGLEIDQRCVELAAFALALAAWRFPDAGGYRVLPDLNVACCGLSVSVAKEEWKELAKDNSELKIALDWMYDEFKDAPVLGSLLNPETSTALTADEWLGFVSALKVALNNNEVAEKVEATVTAKGLSKAADLLMDRYDLIHTNVPYLSRSKQDDVIKVWCDTYESDAKADLATAFLSRWQRSCTAGGVTATVTPQNWLFLPSYKRFRKTLLKNTSWYFVARLGSNAFQDMNFWAATTSLQIIGKEVPIPGAVMSIVDVSSNKDQDAKARMLQGLEPCEFNRMTQDDQLGNPDSRITLKPVSADSMLSKHAISPQGIKTGDDPRYRRYLWEVESTSERWRIFQGSAKFPAPIGGLDSVIDWSKGGENFARRQGMAGWGKRGVVLKLMGKVEASLHIGALFDSNVTVVVPNKDKILPAIFAYCSSQEYTEHLSAAEQAAKINNATAVKVPFDLSEWTGENWLPPLYTDDPTQALFHGHPAPVTCVSFDPATAIEASPPLQVAVARLLGYRWPVELNSEIELATDARAWVQRSSQLSDFADDDGIVCIPAVGNEKPAEDRLLNLLHRAYGEGRAQEQVFRDKLEVADMKDQMTIDLTRRGWKPSLPDSFPSWRDGLLEAAGHTGKTLESWLRDKFFTQHCTLFNNRPFIWHIWDGLKDGFSVLVNYHKLDNKLLETLIYTHLNNWINKQKNSSEDGHEERLAEALKLKEKLEKILKGESPHDIFVRWKPLHDQPIGWTPDLNDGVRLNIRPWLTIGDVAKKGAGVLRDKPNCKWTKDRGADVESAPWFHLGTMYGGKNGDRINEHHLTLMEKQTARNRR